MTERIAYSAAPERPPLRWPGGARVALWVAPNIEHYEFLPEHIRVRDPWPRLPHPDILGYGLRDYGNRVGVWRLMEVFDRFQLPCTVSLSMAVLQMYPEIAEAMLKRRWEFMSHGLYNTRYHWNLSEADERAAIEECQQIHRQFTGRGLPGWFSPAASNTLNTPDLVADAGIGYLPRHFGTTRTHQIHVRPERRNASSRGEVRIRRRSAARWSSTIPICVRLLVVDRPSAGQGWSLYLTPQVPVRAFGLRRGVRSGFACRVW